MNELANIVILALMNAPSFSQRNRNYNFLFVPVAISNIIYGFSKSGFQYYSFNHLCYRLINRGTPAVLFFWGIYSLIIQRPRMMLKRFNNGLIRV